MALFPVDHGVSSLYEPMKLFSACSKISVLFAQIADFEILSYAGDVFYLNWDEVLPGATAVVSTIGGFGNEEQMLRINGEANVVAVNAAKDYGKQLSIVILQHFMTLR